MAYALLSSFCSRFSIAKKFVRDQIDRYEDPFDRMYARYQYFFSIGLFDPGTNLAVESAISQIKALDDHWKETHPEL